MICDYCNRNLNVIWQDNMSHDINVVMCEDCAVTKQKCEHYSDGWTYERKNNNYIESDMVRCGKCGEFYR